MSYGEVSFKLMIYVLSYSSFVCMLVFEFLKKNNSIMKRLTDVYFQF